MIFRALCLVLSVAGVTLALAACGGSSSGSSGSTTTSSTAAAASSSFSARRAALRACLEAHGVTLPARRPGGQPPNGGAPGFFGGGRGGGGGGGLAANPKLRAAFQACGGGRFFGSGGLRRRLARSSITAFVSCVRKHGFNLPSPNFSGGPVFPADIRTNGKFQSASRACSYLLVRPAGSGAASGAPPSASS
jgi:hypothetical protein